MSRWWLVIGLLLGAGGVSYARSKWQADADEPRLTVLRKLLRKIQA